MSLASELVLEEPLETLRVRAMSNKPHPRVRLQQQRLEVQAADIEAAGRRWRCALMAADHAINPSRWVTRFRRKRHWIRRGRAGLPSTA